MMGHHQQIWPTRTFFYYFLFFFSFLVLFSFYFELQILNSNFVANLYSSFGGMIQTCHCEMNLFIYKFILY
jgi:hypothetical protein